MGTRFLLQLRKGRLPGLMMTTSPLPLYVDRSVKIRGLNTISPGASVAQQGHFYVFYLYNMSLITEGYRADLSMLTWHLILNVWGCHPQPTASSLLRRKKKQKKPGTDIQMPWKKSNFRNWRAPAWKNRHTGTTPLARG